MEDRIDQALPPLDAELPDVGPALVRPGAEAAEAAGAVTANATGVAAASTTGVAPAAAAFTAGARAAVVAADASGGHTIWMHPLRVAQRLVLEGAEVRDVAVTPLGVERRLEVAGVEVVERVFVPREHAAAVFEWRAPAGATLSVSWLAGLERASSFATPGEDHEAPSNERAAPAWSREGRALWLAGESEDAAAFVLSREPESWDVDVADGPEPTLRVRARLRLGPGDSVRLAIVATTDGRPALAAILASLRPDDLARARAAAARRMQRERLSADAPDERVGPALEWANHCLDGLVAEAPGVGRSIVAGYDVGPGAAVAPEFRTRDAVAAAFASLAVGAFAAARDVLAFLGEHLDGTGRAPGVVTVSGEATYDDPDATAFYLVLTARYLAWTGDIGFVRDAWARVRVACEHVRATGSTEGLAPIALAELGVAAESIGDEALAEALRVRVVRPGAPTLPSFLGAAGAAWAEYAAGRGEAAARVWQRGVEALLALGSPSAMDAAAVVNGFVYGLLGAEPDGVKGRLHLRPQLPASWDRLEARRIRMGDAAIALTCTRDGDRHTFRLEQEEGAVPVTVVFEPLLPARRLVAARVDGVDAELDPRPHGERMLVPVQIVLDAERVVELDVAQDAAPPPAGLRVWKT